MVVFPLSFLVIWGLFFSSGIVSREVASQLLVVNLIWSVASTFQSQANLSLMFDLWAREFSNILRQGVRIQEMFCAHLLFSTIIGLGNLLLFCGAIFWFFGGGLREISLFLALFPHYYLASIGLAGVFCGVVLKYGRSYAFVSWTGLQLLIMFSSPFSPVSTLPDWFRGVVVLSPFTPIFEYVRFGRIEDYIFGLALSVVYLISGVLSVTIFYKQRRRGPGLMDV
jgi:ABC-type polysaccharide/polyol phosphate export permease